MLAVRQRMGIGYQGYRRQPEQLFDSDLVGVFDGQQHQPDIQRAVAQQSHLLFAGQPVEGDLRLPVTLAENVTQRRQQVGVEIRSEANFQPARFSLVARRTVSTDDKPGEGCVWLSANIPYPPP